MGGSRKSAPGGQGRVRGRARGASRHERRIGASRGKRSAEGAERGRAWGGGVKSLPNGEGSGEGAVPPPPENF